MKVKRFLLWLLILTLSVSAASGCIRRRTVSSFPTAWQQTEVASESESGGTQTATFCADAANYILNHYADLMHWNNRNDITVVDLNDDYIPELVFLSQSSASDFVNLDNIAYYYNGEFYLVPQEELPLAFAQVVLDADGACKMLDQRIPNYGTTQFSQFFQDFSGVTEYTFGKLETDAAGTPTLPISSREATWQDEHDAITMYSYNTAHAVEIHAGENPDGKLYDKPLSPENDTYAELYDLLANGYYLGVDYSSAEWEAIHTAQEILYAWRYDPIPLFSTNAYRRGTDLISPVYWACFADAVDLEDTTIPLAEQQQLISQWEASESYFEGVPLEAYPKAEMRESYEQLWGDQMPFPTAAAYDHSQVYETDDYLIYANFYLHDNGGCQWRWKLLRAQAQGDQISVYGYVLCVTQFHEVYNIVYNPEISPIGRFEDLKGDQTFEDVVEGAGIQTADLTTVEFVFQSDGKKMVLMAVNV